MSYKFSAEVWAGDREAFVFRYRLAQASGLWTFCVPRDALERLRPDCSLIEAFDVSRPEIYRAALHRTRSADSTVQVVLTADDIRASRRLTFSKDTLRKPLPPK